MGSCAGCSAPQRTLRENHQTSRNKTLNTTIQHARTQEDEASFSSNKPSKNNIDKLNNSFDILFNDQPQNAWKSRIVTKMVKQYIKPSTLKEEEESNSHNVSASLFDNFVPLVRGPTLRT